MEMEMVYLLMLIGKPREVLAQRICQNNFS